MLKILVFLIFFSLDAQFVFWNKIEDIILWISREEICHKGPLIQNDDEGFAISKDFHLVPSNLF